MPADCPRIPGIAPPANSAPSHALATPVPPSENWSPCPTRWPAAAPSVPESRSPPAPSPAIVPLCHACGSFLLRRLRQRGNVFGNPGAFFDLDFLRRIEELLHGLCFVPASAKGRRHFQHIQG